MTCGKLTIMFLTKVNLLCLFHLMVLRYCLLHRINKNFSANCNLNGLMLISLPSFPPRTNLKLQDIPQCHTQTYIFILLNWYGCPKNEPKILKTSPIFLTLISLITVHSSYLVIL